MLGWTPLLTWKQRFVTRYRDDIYHSSINNSDIEPRGRPTQLYVTNRPTFLRLWLHDDMAGSAPRQENSMIVTIN